MKALLFVFAGLLCAETNSPHIEAAVAAFESGIRAAHNRQYETAAAEFRRAIRIEPTYRQAFEGLIQARLDANRRPEAAAAITELLEIEPSLVPCRLLLGQILLEQNQAERALAQFSLVLKLDAVNPDALYGFATAAKRAGMQAQAAEALSKGRKQYPGDARFSTPE